MLDLWVSLLRGRGRVVFIRELVHVLLSLDLVDKFPFLLLDRLQLSLHLLHIVSEVLKFLFESSISQLFFSFFCDVAGGDRLFVLFLEVGDLDLEHDFAAPEEDHLRSEVGRIVERHRVGNN